MPTPFTLQFHISSAEEGLLLRDFLMQNHISKTALTDIKYHGGKITVNGKEETVRYLLKQNDTLVVQYPPEPANSHLQGENIALNIVYEDEFLLIIDKPAGISTIPSHEHPCGTLANGLLYHYQQISHVGAAHFVTRLDYGTSGLVLVAKHRHIHNLLSQAQQQHAITKEYLAWIKGTLPIPKGRIDLPIARTDTSIIKRHISSNGQPATTLYETAQVLLHQSQKYSLLRLQLLTGRTHQIRVHLEALGHPLLGDRLYGGDCTLLTRQALHCTKLQFIHPITNQPLCVNSSLPQDLQQTTLFQID